MRKRAHSNNHHSDGFFGLPQGNEDTKAFRATARALRHQINSKQLIFMKQLSRKMFFLSFSDQHQLH